MSMPIQTRLSGGGSCLSAHVPKGDPSAAVEPAANRADDEPAAADVLILIVDDDDAVAEATSLLLEVVGYRTLTATDAAAACERLAGSAPTAIICDFHLSRGGTGVDAIGEIRAAVQTQVPAILITGDTSASVAERVKDIRACHLLSKPVDTDELLQLLRGIA